MEYNQDEKTKQTEEWLRNFLKRVEDLPKEERWDWLKNQNEYDEFCRKILEQVYGKAILEGYGRNDILDSDKTDLVKKKYAQDYDGMASAEKKYNQKIDNLAFMEALQEMVCEYKESDEVFVIQKFRVKLYQKYHYELTKNYLDSRLMGANFKNKKKLMNAYAAYKKYKKKEGNDFKDIDLLHESFQKAMAAKYPKEVIKDVIDIIDNNSFSQVCLVGEDEEEKDPFDDVADLLGREDYRMPETNLLEKEKKQNIEKYLDFLVEAYEVQVKGLSVKEREFIRIFFTRTILKCLKLEEGKDRNRKEETKCKGCYRLTEYPAGVKDIYILLKKQEKFYMNTTFHMDYIAKAIEKEPEKLNTLYGIYYNLLRKEFKFTDNVIAEVLSKSKQDVSRYQEKYENFIGQLRKMKEESEWE